MMDDNSFSRVIGGIERVDLRVQDLDSAVAFYSKLVGLDVLENSDGYARLGPGGGDAILTLDTTGVTRPADPTAAGLFHTAIRFPSRPSLGRALRRVAEAGLEIGAADHGVSEALYIDDPSVNGVELYWDRDREVWPEPAPGERIGMFSRPLDLHALLETGDSSGDSATEAPLGTDIGHVHLQASRLDETADFYVKVLGFDLVASLGASASFLSAQGYHHHIGANTWRSSGRPPTTHDRAGLTRIVFSPGDSGEIDSLRGRLDEGGAEYRVGGGQLSVVDPHGVELVFG